MTAKSRKAFGERLGALKVAIVEVAGPSRWDDLLGLEGLQRANEARLELRRFFDQNCPHFPRDLADTTAALFRPLMSALQNMRSAASAQADEFRENRTRPQDRLSEISREHAALSLEGWWLLREGVLPLIRQIEILLLKAESD